MQNDKFSFPKIKEQVRGQWIDDVIPTATIKKAAIYSTIDTNTAFGTFIPSGTASAILTYLHLSANIQEIQYGLSDRNGTFDIFRVGTSVNVNQKTDVILQGSIKAPIHVINGTFVLSNAGGSQSAGSFTWAYEVVQL